MPFPFNPEDLPQILQQLETRREQIQDQGRMLAEATDLLLRQLLDTLTNEQIDILHDILRDLAAEGKDNYVTQIIYGMLKRERHHRIPLIPETITAPND